MEQCDVFIYFRGVQSSPYWDGVAACFQSKQPAVQMIPIA